MKNTPCPQKPGKALDTWLRAAIRHGHKLDARAYNSKGQLVSTQPKDRLFPDGYGHGVELVETVQPDGDVNVWWKGDPHYSAHQINEYARKFCELNHLTGA